MELGRGRAGPRVRVDGEELLDEVDEGVVGREVEAAREGRVLREDDDEGLLGPLGRGRGVVVARGVAAARVEALVDVAAPREEGRAVRRPLDHGPRDGAQDALEPREHRRDGVVLEQDVAAPDLREHAAQGPDVDAGVVVEAEHDLRRAVGPRLDVGRQAVAREARAPEVDDFDGPGLVVLQDDVLGLDVAVDDAQRRAVGQRRQALARDGAHAAPREVALVAVAAYFAVLVQILLEQLRDDHQMLAKIKRVEQRHDPRAAAARAEVA